LQAEFTSSEGRDNANPTS